jgi:hypothetical protein
MAIISIPSSVAGIQIPGAALKGPLGKLFDNKSSISTYTYPQDLGSKTKGHWVQFTINEIQPISFEPLESGNPVSQLVKTSAQAANEFDSSGGIMDKTKSAVTAVKNAVTPITQTVIKAAGEMTDRINFSLTPKKQTQVAAIALYLPETLNFTNNAAYGSLNMFDIADEIVNLASGLPLVGGAVGKVGTAALAAARSSTAKLLLSTQGLAINPQQQILFDGIDFRTFQMTFVFTPSSKQEADMVKDIIKTFKKHAAPKLVEEVGGMFWVPPSTFNLDFFFNGAINTKISRVAECVIENIDVNYAPNGWSAHTDGSPIQTVMTINFKEIELIDRDKIEFEGY